MKLAESMCQRFFEGKAHGIIHGEPKMRSNDLFAEGAEIKIFARPPFVQRIGGGSIEP